jgi:hypothetical protein
VKKIRDAQTIIGMLEHGEVADELSTMLTDTVAYLKNLAREGGKKGKAKGKVTLSLSIEVDGGGQVTMKAKPDRTLPPRPRGETVCWANDDGTLSTEHPQQTDMFAGPRVARERSDA